MLNPKTPKPQNPVGYLNLRGSTECIISKLIRENQNGRPWSAIIRQCRQRTGADEPGDADARPDADALQSNEWQHCQSDRRNEQEN